MPKNQTTTPTSEFAVTLVTVHASLVFADREYDQAVDLHNKQWFDTWSLGKDATQGNLNHLTDQVRAHLPIS